MPILTKLGLHATAVLYTGGSIAQLLKLILNFSWQDMPYVIDWVIITLGTIGAITLITQADRIVYRGRWEKPVHFIIIFHLILSVAVHVWAILLQSHKIFGIFPIQYSYFALLYFLFFAWRSWTVKTRNGVVASNTL